MQPLCMADFHPERGSLGTWAAGWAGKVLLGHTCSFMAPKGTFLIISPRKLINLHSVMNLEISIKNIITNQDRIQSSQGLLTALQWQEVWVWCARISSFWTRTHGGLPLLWHWQTQAQEVQLELPFCRKPRGSRINPQKGESPKKISRTNKQIESLIVACALSDHYNLGKGRSASPQPINEALAANHSSSLGNVRTT